MDTAEVYAPDASERRIARQRTNSRLAPDKHKGPLDLVSDGSWGCISIELPPNRGFIDLRGGAAATRIASN